MLVLRAGLKSSYGSLFLIGVFMYGSATSSLVIIMSMSMKVLGFLYLLMCIWVRKSGYMLRVRAPYTPP